MPGKVQGTGPKKDTTATSKEQKADADMSQVTKAKNGEKLAAATAVAAAAAADVATLSAFKRQPSTMSLMRVGSKISLLSKKKSDSNLSKNTLDLLENKKETGDKRGELYFALK